MDDVLDNFWVVGLVYSFTKEISLNSWHMNGDEKNESVSVSS